MVIRRLQPGIIPNYESHGERAWGHNIIITLLHPHNTTMECPYELAFHNFSWSPISSE